MAKAQAQHPLPTPGHPQLFDIAVSASGWWAPLHLDIQAKFPDYVFPEGAEVSFRWREGRRQKDVSKPKYAPVLYCQAGMWSTPWRDGRPNLDDLCCADPTLDASRVRLEAIAALWAIYEPIAKEHEELLQSANRQIAQLLNAPLEEHIKHMPPMTQGEVGARLVNPAWWPQDNDPEGVADMWRFP